MTRVLKVWGTSSYFVHRVGQVRAIVAARTKQDAADCLSLSLYIFNKWAGETRNKTELEYALSKPGTVFYCPLSCKLENIYTEKVV